MPPPSGCSRPQRTPRIPAATDAKAECTRSSPPCFSSQSPYSRSSSRSSSNSLLSAPLLLLYYIIIYSHTAISGTFPCLSWGVHIFVHVTPSLSPSPSLPNPLLFELCTSPKGNYFAANLFFLFLLSFHRTYPDKAHIYLSSSSFYVLFSLPVSLSKLLRCKI